MWKFAYVALTSVAALSVASLPADAQSSNSNASSTPLPSIPVKTAKPKKAKRARPAPAVQENEGPAGAEGAAAQPSDHPPSIRNQAADTEGTNSYASGAVTVGGKQPLSRRETPQTVSVITRQQMNDQNSNTFWEAMTFAPGVTLVSNNPDQGQYHARGAAMNVAFDGVPSYSGLSGYQQFDVAIYDRLEVLRGPDGLLMGTGSLGGTVNMVRKRPGYDPAVGWSTSYGSWGYKHGELDVTTPLNESKTVRFRGVLAGSDKDFFFDRANEDRWIGYGILEYDLTPTTLLTGSITRQVYDGPSYSGQPAYTDGHFLDAPRSLNVYPDWAYLRWWTTEYASSVEQKLPGDWRAKVSARLLDQTFHFNDAYPTSGVNPATMTATYAERDQIYDYERKAVDAYITGPLSFLGQKHTLLFGYNYDEFDTSYVKNAVNVSVPGVPIFDPNSVLPHPYIPFTAGGDSIIIQSGIYGQARIKLLDPLTVVAGARLTDFHNKSHNRAPSVETPWSQGARTEDELTPYGAVLLDVTKNITVYGSYSDLFIPQTQLRWPSGTLDPRVGQQYEVGVKGEFLNKRVQTSLALFDIQDVNRSYADPEHPNFYLQMGEAESKGLDAEISGRVLPGLELVAGYTYLHTELVKATSGQGNPISYWYPEHTFKLWSKYQFQNEDLKRWSIGAGVLAASTSMTNNTDSGAKFRLQEPYAVVNAMIGYQIEKDLSLTLSVNNIFDTNYYTRLGGLNTYNTPGEPRNFMLTLRKSMN